MAENTGSNDLSNQSNCSESYGDYLKRAAAACKAGDEVLGMHLYLAAYEKASADPSIPEGMAIVGLREAWELACQLKERSMAEYVFEKLEPYLTGEEIADCANELQNMALDRLEEYGFSREELQDMAELISQDLVEGDGAVVKLERFSITRSASEEQAHREAEEEASWAYERDDSAVTDDYHDEDDPDGAPAALESDEGDPAGADEGARPVDGSVEALEQKELREQVAKHNKAAMNTASADDFNPYDMYSGMSSVGKSYHAATNDGSGAYIFTRDAERAAESAEAHAQAVAGSTAAAGEQGAGEPANPASAPTVEGPASASADVQADVAAADVDASAEADVPAEAGEGGAQAEPTAAAPSSQRGISVGMPTMPEVPSVGERALNYSTLAGYGQAVAVMRDFGVGLQRNAGFRNFIGMMNARHGLDRMPALDTLLFRSPVIEDATRFVDATLGEINLPVLRLSMEEGVQGMPVLCVTTQGNHRPRMNQAQNRFEGPGVLVLDELDAWRMPEMPDNPEGIAGFMMANMSRGAREAMNMVRSAVENPDVYVFATVEEGAEVDPFFYELLEPISVIDIGLPNELERDEIWKEIKRDHPSMRSVKRADLLRFSAGLPRYDIYMAARAAIEEAYKAGLLERTYLPVSYQNILDKLAAYQPLDSEEYRAIEDEIVRTFSEELDDLAAELGEASS